MEMQEGFGMWIGNEAGTGVGMKLGTWLGTEVGTGTGAQGWGQEQAWIQVMDRDSMGTWLVTRPG